MIDWTRERSAIAGAAVLYRVDPDFVEAIRAVENGPPGYPFGDLPENVTNYDEALRYVCKAVAHRVSQYEGNPLVWVYHRSRYKRAFVAWFSGKWAPAGAEADPDAINAKWLHAVWKAYDERIAKSGEPG